MIWSGYYSWHDGHTDHHNPRPWEQKTAMDTARNLGLTKAEAQRAYSQARELVKGEPKVIGENIASEGEARKLASWWNANHEAQHEVRPHDTNYRPGGKTHKRFKVVRLAKAVNDQAAGVGVSTYAKFAAPYGQVVPGAPTNLMHYDYQNKLPAVQELVKKHGFQTYYAGGKYGKPDLANKNYNTGHLMIYDPSPQSGGDFGQQDYTNAWRQMHELAHALTYPELNQTYGEGRRIGKLGTHRTLNEAQRAVHWEHLAAHKQRELNKQIGIHVPDETFHREYATVMHDAVHRAVTGQFTEPSAEGFVPHAHPVPLHVALDMVRTEGKKMGLQHQHDLAPRGPK